MGTKILIGVVAGILVGVFLGNLVEPFDVAGKVYVSLLQMTVLPYVVVSLIGKIGKLTMVEAKRLGGRAGIILLALWGISLLTVVIMPLFLPAWEAGTFFSASLIEPPRTFDFLGLYLPTNPFYSLAENIVPASVLFSILLGVALIGIPKKKLLLDPLSVVSDTLGRISNAVVKLSPWGTFALAAAAAGNLSPPELTRLAGYIFTYTAAIILLTFIVLPGFLAALTPFRFRTVMSNWREAGLTAFATGKLFAVLPMVIEAARRLLVEQGVPDEEAAATADVFVPLAYPFPNAGKVLSILFIPFAAWFIGRPLGLDDYPALLSIGLLSFFGSPVAAVPFLLQIMELPLDLFPLFLVAGIWCARLGDVAGAMHLTVFTALASAWNRGLLKVHPPRLGVWAAYSVGAAFAFAAANGYLVEVSIRGQPPSASRVMEMELLDSLAEIQEEEAGKNPHALEPGETRLQRIRRTKILRVGYEPLRPPFVYRNGDKKIVGYDIDLVQRLAADLDATLVLVPCKRADVGRALKDDLCDLVVGSIPSSIDNLETFHESPTYEELHLAFLVLDHRVKEFREPGSVRHAKGLRIGYGTTAYFVRSRKHLVPNAELVEIKDEEAFLRGEGPEVDLILTSAEKGAVWTMLRPEYSVFVPKGARAQVPLVIALPVDAPELEKLLKTWVPLKKDDGTIAELHAHWVLGEQWQKKDARWSIIKDVLRWVD
jgi:Na+/H+-dicarboxylate symporter